jgi:hypothetical protein
VRAELLVVMMVLTPTAEALTLILWIRAELLNVLMLLNPKTAVLLLPL